MTDTIPDELPQSLLIEADEIVDDTFMAKVDRWDGDPDLPRIMVSAIARALLAAERRGEERARDDMRREIARLIPHYQSRTGTDAGRRQMLEHMDDFAARRTTEYPTP